MKLIALLTALVVLAVNPSAMAGQAYIDDGASHIFDDDTYQYDEVFVDYHTDNNPGTHVDLVDGGSVGSWLWAYGAATITMSGGTVGDFLMASGATTITMSGGSVGGNLGASGYGLITMSGGTVGDNLGVEVNGTIYLDGTGFEADGTPLTYGAKLSDFGTLYYNPTYENFYYAGTITGTLADGSALDNTFEIYNTGLWEGTADIYIIPEPCSLVLLGLGGLILRRRRA